MKDLAERPFVLIGVHLNNGNEDADTIKRAMDEEDLNWRSFVDQGAIAERWKPAGTPAFYIIDSKGVIRFKWAGAPGAKAMDTALEQVIEEAEEDSRESPK